MFLLATARVFAEPAAVLEIAAGADLDALLGWMKERGAFGPRTAAVGADAFVHVPTAHADRFGLFA